MSFSYSAIWDDTLATLRRHAALLIAIAGAFLMLPDLMGAYFMPRPSGGTTAQLFAAMTEYMRTYWPFLLLITLFNAVGAIAILLLLFGGRERTVAQAIRSALPLLPGYFVAGFLANLMIAGGALLFLVPGLYLIGRLTPVGVVIAAEGRRNPIEALRRSFDVTKGRGWSVVFIVLVVALAGLLVTTAISFVVGALLFVVAKGGLGQLLVLILNAATGAAFATVLIILYASIYRHLTGGAQSAVPRTSGI